MASQYTSIGGQAVIEGVMMRSPRFLTVAVRRPSDRAIVVKDFPVLGLVRKTPILGKPFLRGVVILLESMIHGFEALTFSANLALADEQGSQGQSRDAGMSKMAIALSLFAALGAGILLFVVLPHLISLWIGGSQDTSAFGVESPLFHVIDGVLKLGFLLGYILAIGQMNDIKRVFQYHGAEHKSIYAFEKGLDLNVQRASEMTTLHPRCGTSFLLFLVFTSILVFSIVLPIFGSFRFFESPVLNQLVLIGAKILLLFPVASLSYELIRLSSARSGNPVLRLMMAPGLMLQRFTTRNPDPDQLEVALVALRRVLGLEKGVVQASEQPLVVRALSELQVNFVQATEFPG